MAKPPGGGPGSKRFTLQACSPGLAVTIPFAGTLICRIFQFVAVRPGFVLIFRITVLWGICPPTAAPHCVPAGDRGTHTPAARHPPVCVLGFAKDAAVLVFELSQCLQILKGCLASGVWVTRWVSGLNLPGRSLELERLLIKGFPAHAMGHCLWTWWCSL